jgi:glycosyltransferase involved in cell wall biosynthesis
MRVLLIGPFSPPITGESLANDLVLKNLNKDSAFKIDYINNTLLEFNESAGEFSFSKAWLYFKKYLFLYKIVKTQIVYITIGQTFFGVLKYAPFILTARLFNKKIVVHIHGNFLKTTYNNLKGIKKKIVKFVVSKTDKGIVLSELLLPNLKPFIEKKNIYVLPNFVEDILTENFSINLKETNKLKIIFLSNLMTEKGILDLLDALEKLLEKDIDFEAKIAGNIDKSIKKMVLTKIDNNNYIEYLNVVKGSTKKELLIWANVFVLPTYYHTEGQPISLLEAMATGNIILTTHHAGIPDVFSSKNGYFINKKDSSDIVEKLLDISKNLQSLLPMMAYNHKYASNTFTENRFITSLKGILLKQKV